jgi:hypothetical protein
MKALQGGLFVLVFEQKLFCQSVLAYPFIGQPAIRDPVNQYVVSQLALRPRPATGTAIEITALPSVGTLRRPSKELSA